MSTGKMASDLLIIKIFYNLCIMLRRSCDCFLLCSSVPLVRFHLPITLYVTHLHETSRMSAEFVFRYGPKCMGGVILPILVLLHL